ncbi:molybdate ABC transporter substrate-binding protein [Burkholderia cepacia]|uniref:Molybdate-binding periplasmic protein n=1 Tax=Burkholderia cepacia GG4 TaxID=1009846 RepID=A0A9W3PAS2_BURCE|nr:substrate-binding domain-containing protein [Burkholderia cepacia]AFQ49780.1 putative molybdate-binding periplasmic protein precursor [Burkholderia cepacia GG4]
MSIRMLLKGCLVAWLVLTSIGLACADGLKVFSTPTLKSTLAELAPAFESTTGQRLVTTFDNAKALEQRIEAGETFDVAILLPGQIDALVKADKIVSSTRTDVAKASVGMAARVDVPVPAIATVDAFRQALIDSRSLSWSPDSASGAWLVGLLDRLGISDMVRPHLVPVRGGDVIAAVADGTADATVITVPNIVDVPGVRLVGLLPRELQHDTVYTAGIGRDTKDLAAAQALIRVLTSAEAMAVLRKKGFEPPTR